MTKRGRRHAAFRSILALAAVTALAGCLPPPLSGLGQSSTVVVPRPSDQQSGLTTNVVTGPDGNLWFINGSYLKRVTPAGVVTQLPLTGFCGSPEQLARGTDGAVWLTVHGCQAGQIVRISTSGVMKTYDLPANAQGNPQPSAITAGPDGNIWFTSGPSLYRLTPAGTFTAFSPPRSVPPLTVLSITAGPDGALWFTRGAAGNQPAIGRMTTAGVFRYFPTPSGLDNPTAIVRGPDGALWFGSVNGQYGRITPAGAVQIFSAPRDPTGKPIVQLLASTVTPDGSIWFAAGNGVALRVRPDGTAAGWLVAPDRLQTPGTFNGIAYTSNGTLWLSNPVDFVLARMSAGGSLQSTIAVRGTNGALYVQHDLVGHWTNLGGQLLGRPSVLAVNGTDYYFAEGANGYPYVRTDTLGWQRMSSTLRCELPVAAVWENELNLFCGRIADYLVPLPGPGSLPTLAGGQTVVALAQGPSYAIEAPAQLGGIAGGPQAWATALPNGVPLTTYTNRNPHVYWEATPLTCAHAPTGRVSGNTLYLACANAAHQLQYVTAAGGTGPWSAVHTVPVVTGTGDPGLVAVPDGSVLALLTNLDGTVSESQLTPTGGQLQATLSGSASPGVGADGP